MTSRVVAVSTVTTYIKHVLESDAVLADIWIQGEVSAWYQHRSGHIYFTLQDDQAQLKCVLWRAHASRHRHLPGIGDIVVAHGSVSLYEQSSAIQLSVDSVQPAGQGLAALELERLRQRLEAEGLFDETRKRPLPAAPRHIGVITSPDGAVWHDIQHVLRRRYPLTHLILAPTPVQGERAPAGIANAFAMLHADGRSDVIILARGGGSSEDLAAFNDEGVVRAIFASRVPVISGIGHETDWTLADLVADVRAPTPSAAAELCSPSIIDLAQRLAESRLELAEFMARHLEDGDDRLQGMTRRLRRGNPRQRIANYRVALAQSVVRAHTSNQFRFERERGNLTLRQSMLGTLNPRAVLARGFAAVSDDATGAPITAGEQLTSGDRVRLHFADGAVLSRVETAIAGHHDNARNAQ